MFILVFTLFLSLDETEVAKEAVEVEEVAEVVGTERAMAMTRSWQSSLSC